MAAEVRAGAVRRYPWEMFRLCHFPALEHEEAAGVLAEWCNEQRIVIDFTLTKIEAAGRSLDVIFVEFAAAP